MDEWMTLLLRLTLSGSAVAAAAALIRLTCGKWAPRWFLCALCLPVLASFLLPLGTRYSLFSAVDRMSVPGSTTTQQADTPAQTVLLLFDEPAMEPQEGHTSVSVSPEQALFLLWLTGAAGVLVWKAVGYRRFHCRIFSAAQAPEQWEEELLHRLTEGEKAPELLRSAAAPGPMLIGLRHSALILPKQVYPPEMLEDVLSHELCHWRRHDLALKWCAALIVCLHWFNPISWRVAARIEQECELACDEGVLSRRTQPERLRYARSLVLAAAGGPSHSLTAPMCTQKQRLKERLEQIMKEKKVGRRFTVILCAAAVLMAMSTTMLGVYAGNVVPEETTPAISPASSEPVPVVLPAPEQPEQEEVVFQMPLDTDEVVITSQIRVHPITGETTAHNGLDFKADSGTPVYAAASGTVAQAGFDRELGNYIVLEHANDLTTAYAHLKVIDVSAGDTVQAGDLIGQVGNTGMSTGPHLHFEVRLNGEAADPMEYLPVK